MTRAARRIAIRTGKRQFRSAELRGRVGVPHLVVLHLGNDRARGGVALRKPLEMSLQVLLDLAFGFRHEAEAGAVADARGSQADRERASVPERVEQAGPATQFADALLRPRQVVGFLARGLLEHGPQFGAARRERLRVVQRLRADLADVVHAHQRDRFARFVVGERLGLAHPDGGRRARRRRSRGQRAQGSIGGGDQLVEWTTGRFGHVAEN